MAEQISSSKNDFQRTWHTSQSRLVKTCFLQSWENMGVGENKYFRFKLNKAKYITWNYFFFCLCRGNHLHFLFSLKNVLPIPGSSYVRVFHFLNTLFLLTEAYLCTNFQQVCFSFLEHLLLVFNFVNTQK